MSGFRRPLLVSLAVHAALAVLIVVVGARARSGDRPAAAVALDLPAASVAAAAVDVDVTAGGGGGSASAVVQPARGPAAPRRARATRAQPRVALAVPPASAPAPEAAVTVAEAPEAPPAPAAPPGAAADEASAAPAAAAAGTGDGDGDGHGQGTGDGVGDGTGIGDGLGAGQLGKELHARVLGNVTLDIRERGAVPVISHDEATALRVFDAFPRLPEALWKPWKPYIVALEVCVGADGAVSEATLRSSEAPRLDQVVLAAVKTWRYRPRLAGGHPTPFCHGVVIKYERW
jgi:TonB family protein